MFYSHEILTSRKHGVATIWLVATLGSRSSLKKVSRRAILDVDVSKACQTIADPESPMALRLQSSLLYGVSRVFSQQCGYVLTDTQGLNDRMRGISFVMRDLQIDGNVALTTEQLNLPFDPSFNPDLNMTLDLSMLDVSSQSTERSSLLLPPNSASSQSSLIADEDLAVQLQFDSISPNADDSFDLDFNTGIDPSLIYKSSQYIEPRSEEPGIDQNPLFEIDDDGMIIELPDNRAVTANIPVAGPYGQHESDLGTRTEDYVEHVAVTQDQNVASASFNDDQVIMGDDEDMLNNPSDLPFSNLPADVDVEQQIQSERRLITPDVKDAQNDTVAEALQRKTLSKRTFRADSATELSNRHLSEWQDNYLAFMTEAHNERATKRLRIQAKRNAAFWILDQGIGSTFTSLGNDSHHPLSVFSGNALMEALTGTTLSIAGRKRSLSVDASETERGRFAYRQRSETEDHVGRGDQNQNMAQDDGILFHGDDDIELQMGRNPASSLKDQPSLMPWNVLGSSRHGSTRYSAQPGISSMTRSLSAYPGPPSATSGPHYRITSASPLIGKGRVSSRLGSLAPQPRADSLALGIDDMEDPYELITGDLNRPFELSSPATAGDARGTAAS